MPDDIVKSLEVSEGGASPHPENPAPESWEHHVFVGPNGLRAGWRLLIFAGIVAFLFVIFGVVERSLSRGTQTPFSIKGTLIGDGAFFAIFLIASWIMTQIEGRRMSDYGLPARKIFGKRFWQGAIVGFAAITLLLAALWLARSFTFGSIGLHGATLAKYAALWGVAFLVVGFAEEFSLRGYAQFTLTTGIGFWPAAIVLSAAFGSLHLIGNHGEDWIGALAAASVGFLFCLILRRTGDLWMAIGFHAAWDWGETFFYGVPDSGLVAPGHMLNPHFHGNKLLTGGSVGPEGSVLIFVVLALCWILFHFWFRQAKYPNPAALGSRPHHHSPASVVTP